MRFPYGETVYRDRRPQVPDPYRPGHTTAGEWDDPAVETVTILDAFVASSSSAGAGDATRSQVLSTKSLFCPPTSDVRVGDRVRTASGVWYVNDLPSADKNPFTGRQPVLEVPLDGTLG